MANAVPLVGVVALVPPETIEGPEVRRPPEGAQAALLRHRPAKPRRMTAAAAAGYVELASLPAITLAATAAAAVADRLEEILLDGR